MIAVTATGMAAAAVVVVVEAMAAAGDTSQGTQGEDQDPGPHAAAKVTQDHALGLHVGPHADLQGGHQGEDQYPEANPGAHQEVHLQ